MAGITPAEAVRRMIRDLPILAAAVDQGAVCPQLAARIAEYAQAINAEMALRADGSTGEPATL